MNNMLESNAKYIMHEDKTIERIDSSNNSQFVLSFIILGVIFLIFFIIAYINIRKDKKASKKLDDDMGETISWEEFLEKNFSNNGTKTTFGELRNKSYQEPKKKKKLTRLQKISLFLIIFQILCYLTNDISTMFDSLGGMIGSNICGIAGIIGFIKYREK